MAVSAWNQHAYIIVVELFADGGILWQMLKQEGLFRKADEGQLTFVKLFADGLKKVNAKFRLVKGVEFGRLDFPAHLGLFEVSFFAFLHCSIYLQFDLSGLNQHPLNFRLGRSERPAYTLKVRVILTAFLDPAVNFIDVLHAYHLPQGIDQLPCQADLRSRLVYILTFGVN